MTKMSRVTASWRMFKDYPFCGIGLGHFRLNYNRYSPIWRDKNEDKVPDNMFLSFLSEAGIIGFAGFLFFIYYILKKGFKSLSLVLSKDDRNILLSVLSAFIGLLVNINTYDLLYWTTPLILFGMLSGMAVSLVVSNRV